MGFVRHARRCVLTSVLAGLGLPLFGQVDTGTIQGVVRDATGAVVPGAKVTISNEGTSFTQTTQTSSSGTYIFTPLRIGTYTVEAQQAGFKKERRTGLQLNIQQQLVLDFTLEPGELTTVVDVKAEAPILQTENGSVGQVVESKTVNNLPLNGRNYTFLARLTTGVNPGQPEGRGLNANGWFEANGTRADQNNYMLDGIDNNSNSVDFLSGAAYVVKPPIDAIAEFKLQTNAFSAEFGRAGGAVLNASLKSGTNEFHGSVWEFLAQRCRGCGGLLPERQWPAERSLPSEPVRRDRRRTHPAQQDIFLRRLRGNPHPPSRAHHGHRADRGRGVERIY